MTLASKASYVYLLLALVMAWLFLQSVYTLVAYQIGASSSLWTGFLGMYWFSGISISGVFLAISIPLTMKGQSAIEALSVSLIATFSFIWTYEALYHFGFWSSWNYWQPPYIFLPSNQPNLAEASTALVIIAAYRYMHLGKTQIALFAASLGLFLFWILVGYPQISNPGQVFPFYVPNVCGTHCLPQIIVSNPDAFAYPLNALTKVTLAVAFVSLFYRKECRSQRGKSQNDTPKGPIVIPPETQVEASKRFCRQISPPSGGRS